MKMPSALSKGLTDTQLEQLERELKSSVLAKQLKANLKERIEAMEVTEEMANLSHPELSHYLGKRRGYRDILNILPED